MFSEWAKQRRGKETTNQGGKKGKLSFRDPNKMGGVVDRDR
jgi:hypothetical protein